MLLSEFFKTVYTPRKLRGASVNSFRLYRLCISQFGKTLGRDATIDDLTEENVLRHLARRSNVAPATRNKELSQLSAMWRLASRQGMVEGWPTIPPEPEPERAPIAWLADEVEALLAAADRQPGRIGMIPARLWWSALLRVIFDSGERISAVRVARWDWLSGDWLTIPAEARKKKTRDRKYLLNPETIKALSELRRCGDIRDVFPWPYRPNYLWLKYNKVLESAGLPTSSEHKFHCCRKTLGSVVYSAGMDPQDALDHSDRRTTKRYIDPRFQREKQPSELLAEFLANPSLRASAPSQSTKTG